MLGAPAVAWEGIPHVKSPQPRMVTVSDEEFERTLHHADPSTAFVLLCCRDCALRSGAVFALTLRHFNLETETVSTRTKNGAWITAPISARLRAVVAACAATTAIDTHLPVYRLLSRNHFKNLSPQSTTAKRLKRAQKAAGTGGWTWHDLRRTAAHRLYNATGDLRDVRDLLGHGSLHSSLWYLAASRRPVPNSKLALYASGNGASNAA
jgi:integrase